MLHVIVQNQALWYYETALPTVHPLGQGIAKYVLSRVQDAMRRKYEDGEDIQPGDVDIGQLPPDIVDLLRFDIDWAASPSEIHDADPYWEEVSEDFEEASTNGYPLFVGRARVKLPRTRWFRRPRLVLRLVWYVREDAMRDLYLHVFWMKARLE